jgi:hypothetical protein
MKTHRSTCGVAISVARIPRSCDSPYLAASCSKMARIYADVNQQMPRPYWDYSSANIRWGILGNYEVVRKIGMAS